METTEQTQEKPTLVTEGIVLAGCTGLAYVTAFVYELGFCHLLYLPTGLIDLNLTTVLSVATVLTAGAMIFAFWGALMWDGLPARGPMSRALNWIVPLAAAWVLTFAFLEATGLEWSIALLVFVTVTGGELVESALSRVNTASLDDEAIEQLERDRRGAYFALRRRFGRQTVMLGAWLLLLVYGAYLAGRHEAQTRSLFHVIPGESADLAVLRIYGDKAVCVPLERSAAEGLRPKFRVVTLGEDGGQTLELRNIGPIRLMPPTTAPATVPTPTPPPPTPPRE